MLTDRIEVVTGDVSHRVRRGLSRATTRTSVRQAHVRADWDQEWYQ
jgi:hypothetical protein